MLTIIRTAATVIVMLCVFVLFAPAHSAHAQVSFTTPSCQILTPTAISATFTPCVAPTAPPTNPPTPFPTPNPNNFQGFVNGQPFPAGWRPYPSSTPYASPLPSISPGYYTTDSASIVTAQWAKGATSLGQPLNNNEPGDFDTSFPVYISAVTDPFVTLVNPTIGNNIGTTGGVPAAARIPALARATQSKGLPSYFSIFQPDGTELDFSVPVNASPASLNPPTGNWATGKTMPIANIGSSCSNFYTGSGINIGQYAVAPAGQCPAALLTGLNDLLRGEIDHPLAIYTNCVASGSVFPATGSGAASICTSGVAPQSGYLMWYDVSCAATKAAGGNLWQQAILCALNQYGGYNVGTLTGGTIGAGAGSSSNQFGFTIGFESSEPFYAYGNGDKFAAMFAQGWIGRTIPGYAPGFQRWYARPQDVNGNLVPSPVVNFASHIHYLKACVVQQTC